MRCLPAAGAVALVLLWAVVSGLGDVSPLILPTPWAVGSATMRMIFGSGELLPHVGLTSYRTIFAFFLSCLVGVPLGLAMGYMPRVYRSLEFLVDFFRSVPPIALFPLFLLVLGLGEKSKIGVPFYGCTLIIIINGVYGVLNVPSLRRTVGTVYGFSKWQVFWKIVVPDSFPQVFVGMRTALSLALVLTVVVEMFIGSENGLGKKIYDYHLVFETAHMYGAIIVTGSIGYILNKGFIVLEKRIVHWADK